MSDAEGCIGFVMGMTKTWYGQLALIAIFVILALITIDTFASWWSWLQGH